MKFLHSGSEIDLAVEHLYVAGWTGRNVDAVQHHINELAEIGVAPPSEVPLYYRVSSSLLVHSDTIEVLGTETSGEVEPLMIQSAGALWLGLASDHTDRSLETHSVAASKQICAKPASKDVWRLSDVEVDLDTLLLHCSIKEDGSWVSYQEGTLSNILPLQKLISGSGMGDNSAMLCGTLGAIGGVRAAQSYRMELEDPKRNRRLTMEYSIRSLPIVL